jgi:hypothetical protein
VSWSLKILGTCLILQMRDVSVQVILYNFFEESADVKLWRQLVDDNHDKLRELKYATLIPEVGDSVTYSGVLCME